MTVYYWVLDIGLNPESNVMARADVGIVAQRCHTFQGTAPNGAPLFAPINAAQPS